MMGEGRTYSVYGIDRDLGISSKDGTNYSICVLTGLDHLDHGGNLLRFVWKPGFFEMVSREVSVD